MSFGKHIGNEELRAYIRDRREDLDGTFGGADEVLQEIKDIEDVIEFTSYADDPEYLRDDYFDSGEYAEFLADGLGPTTGWPYDCIDWVKAADGLRPDYRQVEILGVTYYVRS